MYGISYGVTSGGAVHVYRKVRDGSVLLLEYWESVEEFAGDIKRRIDLMGLYAKDADSVINEMKLQDDYTERLEEVVKDLMRIDLPDCIINDKDIKKKLDNE